MFTFNKEITVIQAQFSVDYGNMPAFQRRYAARRPEWSLCSQVSTRQMPGRVVSRNLQGRILLCPTVLFPAEPTARQKKSMMDDVTKNTPVRRQGCDTHP
jgi:hypothetical protein